MSDVKQFSTIIIIIFFLHPDIHFISIKQMYLPKITTIITFSIF